MLHEALATLPIKDLKTLQKAYEEISSAYRTKALADLRWKEEHFIAYAFARMPATYGVLKEVLSHIPSDFSISSFLDAGSGTGTGYFAMRERWSHLSTISCIEPSQGMRTVANLLINDPCVHTQPQSIEQASLPPSDMVLFSYSLNELAHPLEAIQKAWASTLKALVIVEPGTPKDYQRLMQIREHLIQEGAFILAPCPHHLPCPLLKKAEDWCHFSTRILRTKSHQALKVATLPYEDEKFCYLIALRTPVDRPTGRLIKKPLKRKGHIVLDVCQEGREDRLIISKKDPILYKRAIKKEWGESWN